MRTKQYEYRVYQDGKIIYVGTKKQIAKVLMCDEDSILKAWRYRTTINGYGLERKLVAIEEINSFNVEKKEEIEEKNKKRNEKKIKYLKKHLLEFGNTVLGCIPRRKVESLLEQLETEEGIKTKHKSVKYEHDKKQRYYIELINEVDNETN